MEPIGTCMGMWGGRGARDSVSGGVRGVGRVGRWDGKAHHLLSCVLSSLHHSLSLGFTLSTWTTMLTVTKSSGPDACSGDPWTPLLLLRTLLLAYTPPYQWDYREQSLGPGPWVNLSVFTNA